VKVDPGEEKSETRNPKAERSPKAEGRKNKTADDPVSVPSATVILVWQPGDKTHTLRRVTRIPFLSAKSV
jgi:hypothetical protein